ncbi:MAG: VOC family protein [Polymorphobacter sp.]
MTIDARLNMIMVGATDIATLRHFYEAGLGWTPWGPTSPMSVMYKLGTAVLVFLNKGYLASESGQQVADTPRSIWAIFVEDKAAVDAQFATAAAAGATITSPVRNRDGGLYSGYFADPEGNGWELVWSPHMPVAADGSLSLPGQ